MVVAAPASGSGKTTVATGLMAALAARGARVSGHKIGPDYIDPGYHALATGRPPRNLDPVLCGAGRVVPLFRYGSAGADIAVIEGVMGLFDGAAEPEHFHGPGDFGSTAHVAHLLDAPVVLVVDAARTSRSAAALVHGFRSYDPRVRVVGVILNQVASDRHEQLLRSALEDVGTPVLGALRRTDAVAAPSRHLGLVPAAERSERARAAVARLGELVARSCDLDAITAAARTAPPLAGAVWDPAAELAAQPGTAPAAGAAPRVAVAGGPAFTFGYTENSELLRAGGAEVVAVDPMSDEKLPDGTSALVVGGGFPEVHAAELSANEPLRHAVAGFAAGGGPVVGECAGLLYLCRTLDGAPMCGVLPADARMTDRLTLGYRAAVAVRDSVLAPAGTRVAGHEFHRTTVAPAHGAVPAWQWRGGSPSGFAGPALNASYLHLHWAGAPHLAARLLSAARWHAGRDTA
ncbi:cobyrinate a,c-diamide synthase [Marinitenerispora sediminis]|uniref:Hydrogenobyrinate a,c-diamide synthase n=1 Tax=Marinitenerispora sediminis TaxID=1931232 RepID=A0A368T584_9ACTN|nr:cobyrinate a,c-diamide synthase [Marinitenerispora sediminis]RCV54298.1 cobyrinic acid a,c-diamide synthase [Marinitenerispora sediminis]RCV56440.1 cobyrinic acid a,c-diamide synthase [Marinitenerispora sediminis]RCV58630.1 cobyrinic acid a,c-diamide synthase [Marinitenerispora sediminis]